MMKNLQTIIYKPYWIAVADRAEWQSTADVGVLHLEETLNLGK